MTTKGNIKSVSYNRKIANYTILIIKIEILSSYIELIVYYALAVLLRRSARLA